MTTHDDATLRQIAAARPDRSTWLSANAGSGKTKVLTDRVARLLLDKVDPQHILCLTYTKAAASEMQNRLFKRLGKWAMLEDDALEDELRGLGHDFVITKETARPCKASVCQRCGNAGRAEDTNHPLILQRPVAAFSARGRSQPAVHRDGRARGKTAAGRGD